MGLRHTRLPRNVEVYAQCLPTTLCCAALEALIPNPKPRSERWVSAAFPAGTEDPNALLCSAAYQVRLPWIVLFPKRSYLLR
jgi:hypothetical protein